MTFLQLSRVRAYQLGVLGASVGSTMLQFFLPMEVSIPLNVLLLGAVFGAIYWNLERRPYSMLMLAFFVLVNVLNLFGLLLYGLDVYTIALLGSYSAIYLLPFALGVFAPLVLFWGLYELQGLARMYKPLRS